MNEKIFGAVDWMVGKLDHYLNGGDMFGDVKKGVKEALYEVLPDFLKPKVTSVPINHNSTDPAHQAALREVDQALGDLGA